MFAFVSGIGLIYAILSLKLKISKIIYFFLKPSHAFLASINGTYIHAIYPNQNPKLPSLVHCTNDTSRLSLILLFPFLTSEYPFKEPYCLLR